VPYGFVWPAGHAMLGAVMDKDRVVEQFVFTELKIGGDVDKELLKSKYLAPSGREFMLDFAVDDMDAFLARLKAKGVPILKRDDSDPSGKFAWLLDPDGTKIELWQPRAP